MGFLSKNDSISPNNLSFTETTVMGTENILWKFEPDQIIFLDFTCIGHLTYKETRMSGGKLFDEYIYIYRAMCPCWKQEKKEEIWLSSMTKAPTSTEKSKKAKKSDKTKHAILVWLNRSTSAQPFH